MAPRSGGDRPAERLFSENGAVRLWGFLAGRKVYWSFALSANWPCKQKGPLQERFPVFFPLPWGLGAPLAVLQRV